MKEMDKKIMIVATIAIIGLIIAIIALSEAFIVISEYHKTSTPSPQPTVAPTAIPNLSSAISDAGNQYVNVSFLVTPFQEGSDLGILNITDISKSNVVLITATYIAVEDGSYFPGTYPGSGYQFLLPNQTATFDWVNPPSFPSSSEIASITVYYQVANQIYYHTIGSSTLG
jgi:hypothetical protein